MLECDMSGECLKEEVTGLRKGAFWCCRKCNLTFQGMRHWEQQLDNGMRGMAAMFEHGDGRWHVQRIGR